MPVKISDLIDLGIASNNFLNIFDTDRGGGRLKLTKMMHHSMQILGYIVEEEMLNSLFMH